MLWGEYNPLNEDFLPFDELEEFPDLYGPPDLRLKKSVIKEVFKLAYKRSKKIKNKELSLEIKKRTYRGIFRY